MVKEDNNNGVTAYISLVFIGLVLFILTVGCLCRMCRPVKKKLIVKKGFQPTVVSQRRIKVPARVKKD